MENLSRTSEALGQGSMGSGGDGCNNGESTIDGQLEARDEGEGRKAQGEERWRSSRRKRV